MEGDLPDLLFSSSDEENPESHDGVDDERMDVLNVDSSYFGMDNITQMDMAMLSKSKYCALHLNIHSLIVYLVNMHSCAHYIGRLWCCAFCSLV